LPLLALQQVVDVGADGAEGLGAGRFGRIDHGGPGDGLYAKGDTN
jgi:hypothetical protein